MASITKFVADHIDTYFYLTRFLCLSTVTIHRSAQFANLRTVHSRTPILCVLIRRPGTCVLRSRPVIALISQDVEETPRKPRNPAKILCESQSIQLAMKRFQAALRSQPTLSQPTLNCLSTVHRSQVIPDLRRSTVACPPPPGESNRLPPPSLTKSTLRRMASLLLGTLDEASKSRTRDGLLTSYAHISSLYQIILSFPSTDLNGQSHCATNLKPLIHFNADEKKLRTLI